MSNGKSNQQANNRRTGLILASVALAFFGGIVLRKLLLG